MKACLWSSANGCVMQINGELAAVAGVSTVTAAFPYLYQRLEDRGAKWRHSCNVCRCRLYALHPFFQVDGPNGNAKSRHMRCFVEQESQDDAEHKNVWGGIRYNQLVLSPMAVSNPIWGPEATFYPSAKTPWGHNQSRTLLWAAWCEHYHKACR